MTRLPKEVKKILESLLISPAWLQLVAILRISGDLIKNKQYNVARRFVVDYVKGSFSQIRLLLEIAQDSKKAEYLADARKIAFGIENDDMSKTEAFADIAAVTGKKEDFDEVVKILDKTEDKEERDIILLALITALMKTGKSDEARKMTIRIKGEYETALAWIDIAEISRENQDINLARKMLFKAKEKTPLLWLIDEWLKIFKISKKLRDLKEARKTAAEIKDYSEQSKAWIKIAEISKKITDLNSARKAAAKIKDASEESESWGEIYHISKRKEELENARIAARKITNYSKQAEAWREITNQSQNYQDFENAKRVIFKIGNDSERIEARKELLELSILFDSLSKKE